MGQIISEVVKTNIQSMELYLTVRHCKVGRIIKIKIRGKGSFGVCVVEDVKENTRTKSHGNTIMLCKVRVLEWL